MDDAVQWAVVGTGKISRSVLPDLLLSGDAHVRTVYSRSSDKAESFAAEYGVGQWTSDYDALLADPAVQAVYLATPFAIHHAMTRAALEAGKHVLVEKPIALTAAEVGDLFALARSRGLFLMEAMWMKFNPAFRHLLELLATGRIGEPRNLRAGFGLPFPTDGGSRWDLARSGSTLLDQGIYPVTFAHAVFGEPESVYARGSVRPDGLDLAEHFTLEYSDGRFAQCASSMVDFADPTASVSGRLGWISIPGLFWTSTSLRVHADGWDAMVANPHPVDFPKEGNGYVPMLRAVGQAIREGRTEHPLHTGADTEAVFRTMDAIRAQLAAQRIAVGA
ncbi:Gfo/Idh/MocA family protein [Naasia sp. SYSU D00948]|uniref:Gfo/Idh/MocA family protein n=1 Tax=Naasia sp. SYSU D00948 TaxID=2817379 RepID=UPI001B31395F|nr:Gfo/Idh/MocA family oxidoreductase [Naasia sp. SYSU D00948]